MCAIQNNQERDTVSINVSFVKTPEELAAFDIRKHASFFHQEKIQVFWAIPQEVYEHLLPPGLEPTIPLAIAYVSNFTRPEHLYPYTEGALFVTAAHKGVPGCYCLSMPLDGNDQAQNLGREYFGYPKKTARVKLIRRGDVIEGWIERNDVRIFEVKAEIGAFNIPDLGEMFIGYKKPETLVTDDAVYNLHYEMNSLQNEIDFSDRTGRSYRNIRLLRQYNDIEIHSAEPAKVISLTMNESEDDPWAELVPDRIIGAEYVRYTTHMKGCDLCQTYETKEERESVLPYMFLRWDSLFFGKYHASYKSNNFYR